MHHDNGESINYATNREGENSEHVYIGCWWEGGCGKGGWFGCRQQVKMLFL